MPFNWSDLIERSLKSSPEKSEQVDFFWDLIPKEFEDQVRTVAFDHYLHQYRARSRDAAEEKMKILDVEIEMEITEPTPSSPKSKTKTASQRKADEEAKRWQTMSHSREMYQKYLLYGGKSIWNSTPKEMLVSAQHRRDNASTTLRRALFEEQMATAIPNKDMTLSDFIRTKSETPLPPVPTSPSKEDRPNA